MALRGISSNWLRSLLTMLGVLIGVAAVIVLLAVGTGSSEAVAKSINSLGTNTLTVFSGGGGRSTSQTGTKSSNATLTTTDVKLISDSNSAPDVQSVSPVISTNETATYKGATYSTSVIGSTPSYLPASNYTISAGRSISAADVKSHAQVVDLGSSVTSSLFPTGSNPLGKQIQLGSSEFTVIGLLASKGSSGLSNGDAVAIAPYTAVQDQLTGQSQSFSELLVQGKSSATLTLAQSEVESILAAQNNTTVANLPFSVLNQASLLSTATSSSKTFTALLGWVAAVSLLVGAIGVMNIMLVTVTERTREIGIRKAIGAPKSVVLEPVPDRSGGDLAVGRRHGRPRRPDRRPIQDRRRAARSGHVFDSSGIRCGAPGRCVRRSVSRVSGGVASPHRCAPLRVAEERNSCG